MNFYSARTASRSPLIISTFIIGVLMISGCVAEPVATASPPPPANAVAGTAPGRIALGEPTIVSMSTHSSGPRNSYASWQYINGNEAFNDRLDARLFGLLDAYAGGRHEPAAKPSEPAGVSGNGMAITHELNLATGSVVGVRFRQAVRADGVFSVRTDEITYEDIGTGEVSASVTLLNPDELGTVRRMLGEVPAAPAAATSAPVIAAPSAGDSSETGTASPAGPVSDSELFSAVAFTASGDLTITFDRDPETGADLEKPASVNLTADATEEVISAAGQTLRTSLMAGVPFNAPVPSPAGSGHVNCDLVPCAALTYDDGPNAQTARLLGILGNQNVFATFFQQGGYVNGNPAVAKSVAEAGHTIANHTMSHPYLTRLTAAGIVREVQGAQRAIEKATGVVPGYLRPPYGATNRAVAASAGLPQIIWDVDSMDWQSRNKDVFIPRIMSLVKPGSIILQHDIHAATVDGQDELIAALKARGFYLVTLPQLFQGIKLQPGVSYKCRGSAPGCIAGR